MGEEEGDGGWDELYDAGTEIACMEVNYFNYLIPTSVRCTQNCCVRKRGGAGGLKGRRVKRWMKRGRMKRCEKNRSSGNEEEGAEDKKNEDE